MAPTRDGAAAVRLRFGANRRRFYENDIVFAPISPTRPPPPVRALEEPKPALVLVFWPISRAAESDASEKSSGETSGDNDGDHSK